MPAFRGFVHFDHGDSAASSSSNDRADAFHDEGFAAAQSAASHPLAGTSASGGGASGSGGPGPASVIGNAARQGWSRVDRSSFQDTSELTPLHHLVKSDGLASKNQPRLEQMQRELADDLRGKIKEYSLKVYIESLEAVAGMYDLDHLMTMSPEELKQLHLGSDARIALSHLRRLGGAGAPRTLLEDKLLLMRLEQALQGRAVKNTIVNIKSALRTVGRERNISLTTLVTMSVDELKDLAVGPYKYSMLKMAKDALLNHETAQRDDRSGQQAEAGPSSGAGPGRLAARSRDMSPDDVFPGQESAPPFKRFKSERSPLEVPSDLADLGVLRYEGHEPGPSRTVFSQQRRVYDVDEKQWAVQFGQARQLIVDHQMEPDAKANLIFQIRSPDQVGSVYPDYADERGYVHPNVKLQKVEFGLTTNEFLQRIVSHLPDHHERPNREYVKGLIPGLTAEVIEEQHRLIENSRATVHPSQRQLTFLAQRTETRRLTDADLLEHEGALRGQYGLVATRDVPPGKVLGIYAGVLLRGSADEERVAADYPNYQNYLLDASSRNTARPFSYSAVGMANGTAFANTALKKDGNYDLKRINAMFVPFDIHLTDKNYKSGRKVVSVLVPLKHLRPGDKILVPYGHVFRLALQPPSERDIRAGMREVRTGGPRVKQEE